MENKKDPLLVLFPGMGADERLFRHLDTCGLETMTIRYPIPEQSDNVEKYASRIAEEIPSGRPLILAGVSMGGVIAQELAAQMQNCRGLILISTIKNQVEIPGWLKKMHRFKLYHLFRPWLIRYSLVVIRWFIGSGSHESYRVFKQMLFETPSEVLSWGMRRIPEWNGKACSVPVFHIHGDRDHLFPVSRIREALVIKGGKHFMVFNHAGHVNPVFRGCMERLIRQIQ